MRLEFQIDSAGIETLCRSGSRAVAERFEMDYTAHPLAASASGWR